MKKTNKFLLLSSIMSVLALSACSSDDTKEKEKEDIVIIPEVSFSGKVIDGYISGAVVFLDENNNKELDNGEFSTTTDSSGDYLFVVPSDKLFCAEVSPIVVNVGVGAVDLDNGVVETAYQLVLPPMLDGIRETDVHITPLTSDIFKQAKITATCSDYLNDTLLQNDMRTKVSEAESFIAAYYDVTVEDLYSDIVVNSDLQEIAQLSLKVKQQEKSKKEFILTSYQNNIENMSNEQGNQDDGQKYENASFASNPATLLSVDVTYLPYDSTYGVYLWEETITRNYADTNTQTVMVSLVDSDFVYQEYVDEDPIKNLTETKSFLDSSAGREYIISKEYVYTKNECNLKTKYNFIAPAALGEIAKTYSVENTYSVNIQNSVLDCTLFTPNENMLENTDLSIYYPSESGYLSNSVYSFSPDIALEIFDTSLVHLEDFNTVYRPDTTDSSVMDQTVLVDTIDALDYEFDDNESLNAFNVYKSLDNKVGDIYTSTQKNITYFKGFKDVFMNRTTYDMSIQDIYKEYSFDNGLTWTPDN